MCACLRTLVCRLTVLKAQARRLKNCAPCASNVCTVLQAVLTAGADATLRLWAVRDGTCVRTFSGLGAAALRARFVSLGTQILSTGGDGLLKIWNVASGALQSRCDFSLLRFFRGVWDSSVTGILWDLCSGAWLAAHNLNAPGFVSGCPLTPCCSLLTDGSARGVQASVCQQLRRMMTACGRLTSRAMQMPQWSQAPAMARLRCGQTAQRRTKQSSERSMMWPCSTNRCASA